MERELEHVWRETALHQFLRCIVLGGPLFAFLEHHGQLLQGADVDANGQIVDYWGHFRVKQG